MDDTVVEPFDKHKHERAGFHCGQPSLDSFLRTLVTQYEKRKLGKTFVAVRAGENGSGLLHTCFECCNSSRWRGESLARLRQFCGHGAGGKYWVPG